MTTRFGRNVLSVFDVWEDSRDFLATILESGTAPEEEARWLFHQSLTGGAEDWHRLIACARSIQHARDHNPSSLEGSDVLTYVWEIFNGLNDTPLLPGPWEETDRLIALAKELEREPEILPPSLLEHQHNKEETVHIPRAKNAWSGTTSHYWSDESSIRERSANTRCVRIPDFAPSSSINQSVPARHQEATTPYAFATTTKDHANVQPSRVLPIGCPGLRACSQSDVCYGFGTEEPMVRKKHSVESSYFLQQAPAKNRSLKKRPPPGTVPCIPFPPLTSPSFGIVQEKMAHEPFWLLIAITFLIKTNGQLALPVFYKVKDRFPTPSHMLDPSNEDELLDMIRHLGLCNVRVAYVQKYARAFLEQPPRAGIRHRVRNYDRRDISPPPRNPDSGSEGHEMAPLAPERGGQDLEAWEIGHMTQGKYAIDSWRIFCRDELLGRAEDWNGKGREPEFQPEWMRVRPDDKELRACLRWMWMREGWEWDPATGERAVLREELRRAVNEGRVEYDDTGALRILDEPKEDLDEIK